MTATDTARLSDCLPADAVGVTRNSDGTITIAREYIFEAVDWAIENGWIPPVGLRTDNLYQDGRDVTFVDSGNVRVNGRTVYVVYGIGSKLSANTVSLYGETEPRIYAFAGSTVYARVKCRVYAGLRSTVHATDCTVIATSGSWVCAGRGSDVYAQSGSRVYARTDSTVHAQSESVVVVHPHSQVYEHSGAEIHLVPGARTYRPFC